MGDTTRPGKKNGGAVKPREAGRIGRALDLTVLESLIRELESAPMGGVVSLKSLRSYLSETGVTIRTGVKTCTLGISEKRTDVLLDHGELFPNELLQAIAYLLSGSRPENQPDDEATRRVAFREAIAAVEGLMPTDQPDAPAEEEFDVLLESGAMVLKYFFGEDPEPYAVERDGVILKTFSSPMEAETFMNDHLDKPTSKRV